MKTFAIHTLGCKVNSYESEAYTERCLKLGYQQVDFKEKSDLYLINTCAVTNTAASKSRQKIHQAMNTNPHAFIAVIGCYSQAQSEELEKMGVDAIVGSDCKEEFLERLDELVNQHQKINLVHELKESVQFEDLSIEHFTRHTRAFLKVQDGCNQFCSYCIIPYTRGKERSLELSRAIQLAQRFVENGHHEIVLSGIHTGRYGRDLNTSLAELIGELLKVQGLERIRISSIEINEVSDELIQLMKENEQIARHLHIPLQSGCDAVLKRMHRPYDMNAFMNRVAYIRQQLPDISISTDIIAGFPEESDQEFDETVAHVKKIRFSFMHVFPYSKRDKTAAGQMRQVHGAIKKQRAAELAKISDELKEAYYEQFIGKECRVLVEKYEKGRCFGYSSEYIPVSFEGHEALISHCIKVRITACQKDSCSGLLEDGYEMFRII